MIKIHDPSLVWTACCHTPAYPDYEAVIVRGDDPAQFTRCLHCDLVALLEQEKAERGGEMAGTNMVARVALQMYQPALQQLERQFERFADNLDSDLMAVGTPLFMSVPIESQKMDRENWLIQVVFAIPRGLPEDDIVFEQIANTSGTHWDFLQEHFTHRVFSAKAFTSGVDGPIISAFRAKSNP